MEGKPKPSKAAKTEQETAWETRHRDDARGPLADNSSGLPDRSADLPEGSPGEVDPLYGSGFQEPVEAAHPNFPDQGEDAMRSHEVSDEAVRRRAHQLWEEAGRPEGGHEEHWLQAERELRGRRSSGAAG